mmetsp:Transcript_91541/g.200650  ORF Transcript_91541/g.200650 Transcript_91541/m.200650 type:complete len:205 (+) Transcript_91541:68-682(+)
MFCVCVLVCAWSSALLDLGWDDIHVPRKPILTLGKLYRDALRGVVLAGANYGSLRVDLDDELAFDGNVFGGVDCLTLKIASNNRFRLLPRGNLGLDVATTRVCRKELSLVGVVRGRGLLGRLLFGLLFGLLLGLLLGLRLRFPLGLGLLGPLLDLCLSLRLRFGLLSLDLLCPNCSFLRCSLLHLAVPRASLRLRLQLLGRLRG